MQLTKAVIIIMAIILITAIGSISIMMIDEHQESIDSEQVTYYQDNGLLSISLNDVRTDVDIHVMITGDDYEKIIGPIPFDETLVLNVGSIPTSSSPYSIKIIANDSGEVLDKMNLIVI